MNEQNINQTFAHLCQIMERLRSPEGCAWDREQSLASLKRFLLEETYELLETLDENNPKAHCEELGDLLLQIVFQTEIRKEQGDFTIEDVILGIAQKLVRRHPHVFAKETTKPAENAENALAQWEQIKRQEKPQTSDHSALNGVSKAMPAMSRALKISEKAVKVGFEWKSVQDIMQKVDEEWSEFHNAFKHFEQTGGTEEVADELGDVFFTLVNVARKLKFDPEELLRAATHKFERRFRVMETLVSQNKSIEELQPDEAEALWRTAKTFLDNQARLVKTQKTQV